MSGRNKVGGVVMEIVSVLVFLRCFWKKERNGDVSWGDYVVKGDVFFFVCEMVCSAVFFYVDGNNFNGEKFERKVL